MGNALLATSALAFAGALAAGQASAADKLSVGVGGYMQQWFGYANRDDDGADGGWAAQADSEIHFRGSLESDMGLNFTVHVELEGDRGTGAVKDDKVGQNFIDESYARVSGEFGQLEFGARDHAMVRMHYGISDVGIGLTAGDTQKWVPGTYLDTYGHGIGNARKLNYISPRLSGIQIGVSYAPDDTAQTANTTAPNGNDDAGWGAAINFQQEVGDMAVSVSLGHKSTSSGGTESFSILTDSPAEPGMIHKVYTANQAITDLWSNHLSVTALDVDNPNMDDDATTTGVDEGRITNLNQLRDAVAVSRGLLNARPTMDVKKSTEDSTYTNAGIGVSFGAFKFNVAYATSDQPTSYALTTMDGVIVDADHTWDHDGDGCAAFPTGTTDGSACNDDSGTALTGSTLYTLDIAETAANDDPSNDNAMTQMVVEGPSADYDVWGVSVSYADGPMAVSLGHMMHEDDAGGERTATMLSGSYTLAPGVDWKSSIFTVEDTTGHKDVTGGQNEGTGFVTGIALNF